jgi:hypothetical protein
MFPVYYFASMLVTPSVFVWVSWVWNDVSRVSGVRLDITYSSTVLCMRPDVKLSGQEILDVQIALAKNPGVFFEPVTATEAYYV